MELFPITLPKSNICTETALYYRSSKPVKYNEAEGTILMDNKTSLSLDTYFNCFSYQKYLQYTHARVLEAHVWIQGEVQLRLWKAELVNKKVKRTPILAQTVHHDQPDEAVLLYDFSKETGNGFLYLEIVALSKTATFAGGYYASPIAKEHITDTKLAVVICTYKREAYVKGNLEHLNQTIFTQDIGSRLEVFVVDNGQTLSKDDIENDHIKLFPNKNYGGSGGFTRGIIEALRRKEAFSHVLLMDDDILLESNVLVKTIRFLQIVRPEHLDLAIGGSMLRLDDMTVQHEAGGTWTGLTVRSINGNLNLADVNEVILNETGAARADFCGWWYCCIPLCLIDENNLPLPFFIKIDDIEYGKRITKKLIFLNGIGVWHEPFSNKEKAYLDYYNVRNKLVFNTLHDSNWGILKTMFILMYYLGRNLLRENYKMIKFPIMGFRDFLRGPQYLLELDSEEKHQELLQKYREVAANDRFAERVKYLALAGIQFLKCFVLEVLSFRKNRKKYLHEFARLKSSDFWCGKLEIENLL